MGGEVSNAGGSLDDVAGVFPQIFDLLRQGEGGEESIRRLTRVEIGASDTLLRHFSAVAESVIVIEHFVRGHVGTGNDELTIQHLGIRLFNSAAGAVQSLMSGYYQNSVMSQRDLVARLLPLKQEPDFRMETLAPEIHAGHGAKST
jgi:hypothetical protein